MRQKIIIGIALLIGLPLSASAFPVIWWQVGDGVIHYQDNWKDYQDGLYTFEFAESTDDYSIQGVFSVDSDPYIAWGLSVFNNTNNPMNFTTGVLNTFFAPLGPQSTVYGSFSGSVTDLRGDGVSVTPIASRIQTSTLNGFTNMGVDVGAAYAHGPGVPGASYVMPADDQGPKAGPAGVWTSMELEAAFTLSGFDIATQNGFASIQPIPEPSALLLLGTGLVGLAFVSRKKRRP